MQNTSSLHSVSWSNASKLLYGSTTISDTFGDGRMLTDEKILSGYSSRRRFSSSVPRPDPVPPPREWNIWNPCKQSQDSASFRSTSKISSTFAAPLDMNPVAQLFPAPPLSRTRKALMRMKFSANVKVLQRKSYNLCQKSWNTYTVFHAY